MNVEKIVNLHQATWAQRAAVQQLKEQLLEAERLLRTCRTLFRCELLGQDAATRLAELGRPLAVGDYVLYGDTAWRVARAEGGSMVHLDGWGPTPVWKLADADALVLSEAVAERLVSQDRESGGRGTSGS